MEAQLKSRDGRLIVKVEGETQRDIFRELASAQQVFEAESECGLCQSNDLRFSARIVDDNEYFELVCNSCGAKFNFGQHKKGGGLFPKRKNQEGKPLPNGGWARYDPQKITF